MHICSMVKTQLINMERIDVSRYNDSYDADIDELLSIPLQIPFSQVADEDAPLLRFLTQASPWRAASFAAMMWRLQIQVITDLVFQLLFFHDFVDLSGFHTDVVFTGSDCQPGFVQQALSYFEFYQRLDHPPRMAICDTYRAPLFWLAVMIVRGTRIRRIEPMIELLESTNILGAFDWQGFRSCWPVSIVLRRQPRAMEPWLSSRWDKVHAVMWLPVRISPQTSAREELYKIIHWRLYWWRLFEAYFQTDYQGVQYGFD